MLPAGPKQRPDGPLPEWKNSDEFFTWADLEPYAWQAPILTDLTADQRPRLAYVQVGRKNGKSYLAACLALDEMIRKGGQVFMVADSERNLKSALFFELQSLVRASSALSACVLLYKDHLECPQSGGGVYLRPNNLSASQSINPDLVLFDEVHMQRDDQIWNGMTLAGAAKRRGLLLGITTPGYQLVSLAHDLYEQARQGRIYGRIFEPSDPGCAIDNETAIREANPVLTERPDMLDVFAHERAVMPEHDYRRFRLGQWTATSKGWLPYEAVAAAQRPQEYTPGERLWVGFDGSYSGDSTALVACNAALHVKVLGTWENPGRKGWRVPRDEVITAVEKVMSEYPQAQLYPDPPYWGREIAEWDLAWPERVIEFPTNSHVRMAHACSSFEAGILEGKVSHDGDKRLVAHIMNAETKDTPSGVVIVKAHKDSPAKIDLAVAASIAVHYAKQEGVNPNDVWCM